VYIKKNSRGFKFQMHVEITWKEYTGGKNTLLHRSTVVIQYKALIFYNNICNLNDNSLEKEIARRQLSIKNNNSKSWFVEIKKLLLKYDLEDPIILLENTIKKEEWKRTVNKAINFKWKTQFLETKKLYKNLQYLNVGNPYYKGIHNLLRINCKSARDVDRILVKLKLITGTYLLQTSKATIKKNDKDGVCLICGGDDETVEHFILQCPALSVVRDPVITEISFILYDLISSALPLPRLA